MIMTSVQIGKNPKRRISVFPNLSKSESKHEDAHFESGEDQSKLKIEK